MQSFRKWVRRGRPPSGHLLRFKNRRTHHGKQLSLPWLPIGLSNRQGGFSIRLPHHVGAASLTKFLYAQLKDVAATVRGLGVLPPNNEYVLMQAAARQPISVAVDSSDRSWRYYKKVSIYISNIPRNAYQLQVYEYCSSSKPF